MRVISGKRRGTKLMAPEGIATRPTTDRLKESLFNMIAFDIPGSRFLDLFSGSGAIGIESLSRGAINAVFVEKDKAAITCIKKNLEKTCLKEGAIVYNMDILESISLLQQNKQQFDIVFLDPPYQLQNIGYILHQIVEKGLLAKEGYIILERSSDIPLPELQTLQIIKEKTYKTTTFSFMKGLV